MASLITSRTGGLAGLASAPVALVIGGGLLLSGGDQRANLVLFAMPGAILLMLACLLELVDAHQFRRNRVLTSWFVLSIAGLLGVSAFYLVVALSAISPGAGLLESEAAEAVGTLLGSLLVMVILPGGLLLLGIGLLKARVLPPWARPLPLALFLLLVFGAAAVAVVEDDEVIAAAILVSLGATWALLGLALLAVPSPSSRR